MVEKLTHLKIIQKEFPIYLSDYNDWMINLALAQKHTRSQIAEFYRKILSKIEGDCLTNNLFFYINDKPFTYENIIKFDIKDAMKMLDMIQPKSFVDNQIQIQLRENTCIPTASEPFERVLMHAKKLAQRTEKTKYPCFYYYQLPIAEEQLLESFKEKDETYFRIRNQYLPYLRYFDLSRIILKKIDLRGVDLSRTNLKGIDFASIYQNSLDGTNLENVSLIGQELINISAKKSNLCGTYLAIDINSVDLEDAIVDDSIIFYSDSKGIIPSNFTYVKRKNHCNLHF